MVIPWRGGILYTRKFSPSLLLLLYTTCIDQLIQNIEQETTIAAQIHFPTHSLILWHLAAKCFGQSQITSSASLSLSLSLSLFPHFILSTISISTVTVLVSFVHFLFYFIFRAIDCSDVKPVKRRWIKMLSSTAGLKAFPSQEI